MVFMTYRSIFLICIACTLLHFVFGAMSFASSTNSSCFRAAGSLSVRYGVRIHDRSIHESGEFFPEVIHVGFNDFYQNQLASLGGYFKEIAQSFPEMPFHPLAERGTPPREYLNFNDPFFLSRPGRGSWMKSRNGSFLVYQDFKDPTQVRLLKRGRAEGLNSVSEVSVPVLNTQGLSLMAVTYDGFVLGRVGGMHGDQSMYQGKLSLPSLMPYLELVVYDSLGRFVRRDYLSMLDVHPFEGHRKPYFPHEDPNRYQPNQILLGHPTGNNDRSTDRFKWGD